MFRSAPSWRWHSSSAARPPPTGTAELAAEAGSQVVDAPAVIAEAQEAMTEDRSEEVDAPEVGVEDRLVDTLVDQQEE